MSNAAVVSDIRSPLPPRLFRPLAPRMVQTIIAQVHDAIPVYAGGAGNHPCQLLPVAGKAAVMAFVDGGLAREIEQRKLDELFRRLGYSEARLGRDRALMVTALRIASRCVWEEIADFAVQQQYSVATLRDIAATLLEFTDHLREQLQEGYELGCNFLNRDQAAARQRLLDYLARSSDGRISPLRPLGTDHEELTQLARTAGWPVPQRVVALNVSFHGDAPQFPDRPEILSRVEAERVIVLCPAADAEALVSHLAKSGTDRRVALSWAVRPEEAGSALLWTARALDLVQLGILAPTPLIRCTDHVTQLWLHAEPAIRQRLCQDLLEPLLGETPNSREILSDTLLAWLETRDSAPAIAARLDVHPQTVRYRWKRINEHFGDSLHDPDFILKMTMVLKTSLQMWKAGNQSDFERFRDGLPD